MALHSKLEMIDKDGNVIDLSDKIDWGKSEIKINPPVTLTAPKAEADLSQIAADLEKLKAEHPAAATSPPPIPEGVAKQLLTANLPQQKFLTESQFAEKYMGNFPAPPLEEILRDNLTKFTKQTAEVFMTHADEVQALIDADLTKMRIMFGLHGKLFDKTIRITMEVITA